MNGTQTHTNNLTKSLRQSRSGKTLILLSIELYFSGYILLFIHSFSFIQLMLLLTLLCDGTQKVFFHCSSPDEFPFFKKKVYQIQLKFYMHSFIKRIKVCKR